MIKKILLGIGISFVALMIIALIALQIYSHSNNPTNKEELLAELNPLMPELINWFDESNLDDPGVCKEELEQIGYNPLWMS